MASTALVGSKSSICFISLPWGRRFFKPFFSFRGRVIPIPWSSVIAYISNSSTFPLPLSEEEEALHLARMKNGDSDSRNILIEHNLRLVAHITKKFEGSGGDIEDLISIGSIGLIKAVNTFDPGKGTRLATYAARCVENEILMHLRATRKLKGEVSIYDPIGTDKEGNDISLIDVLSTEQDTVAEVVENRLEQDQLAQYLRHLGKREKKVLEQRYGLLGGQRQTQRDIARKMGISRSYVSRIEKKAIMKLLKELETEKKAARDTRRHGFL